MQFKTLSKKAFLLMLLMAIFMPWAAKAQETLTVCDGTVSGTTTATNSYIPIYGSYVDTQGTTSEFIIPATTEGMDELVGGEISKLTFYISNSPASWGSPVIQIYMGVVEGTTLNSLYGPTHANVTIVAEKTLSNTQAEMEIELDTPYTYEGGNLLIGTYVKTKSNTYKATNFSGISAPYGSSWNKYSSYGSGNAQSFLPKTTFTYTPAGGMSCAKPLSITPDDITSNSATIYWTGESDTYNVQYKKSTDSEWTNRATNYSGYSVELTELEANTSYQVQVQSICEGDVLSGWKSASFETPCAAENTFPFYENFNSLTTNGEIPECWNNDEGTSTNANNKWSYYATGHEGKCVRFNSYSNSYNTNFLKTVPMDLPANKTMQLRFWYKNPTGGDFSIYISTDGGTTHTTALEEHLANQTDWSEEEIVLGNYVGQNNVVIVFKGTSNNGSGDAYIYLDDVYVEEAPTCPKQNALHVTTLTSSSVTLDWTAGTNDQDHWDLFITTDATITPDASTTPTVINSNQKPFTHSGVNDGTTYYAYVRARCSDNDQSPWSSSCKFTTPQTPVAIDGNHPYSTDFESGCDWMFINGDYINQWCYGSAANNTPNGEKAIYISNDNGVTNAYSAVKSVEYATKNFTFAAGVYTFSFDWKAKGNQYYDFIRVALVPSSVELVSTENAPFDKTSLPSGWIALDGGTGLNNNTSWQTVVADEISVPAGDYRMVVGWRNFVYGSDNQPPAAIDNVSISLLTCPRPTNLTASDITGRTATLAWTENGTATEWVLEYGTTSDFAGATSVVVNETPSKSLISLTPETTYYARVKASCSNTDKSVWSDVTNFTTVATCPKPTLSYVSYSNTAYSGAVSWTGSTADAFEIAYRPTSDFDPSDYTLEDVTRVQLKNVTEYTYTLENLTPETKYYIYVQADCGSEDGKSAWSNRVTFTTLATCLAPSSLTFVESTSSSVTMSWTKGADDQDAWQFRYKKTSDNEYTYVLVENQPTAVYTLEDLEPATSYYVNVRAWCGGDDYSKWSYANQTYDLTVTTTCAALSLPYTCDFEGEVETGGHFSTYSVPKCWGRIEMQYGSYSPYTYYPYVYNYSSDAHSGTKSLRMYRTPNSADQTAILPEIDEAYEMSNLQIRFWAKAGSSNNTLSVGIMENNSFVEVATVKDVSTTYAEFTVPLSNYSGNGRNIAIKCGSSTGYTYLYYNIDDVLVEVIPTCWVPTALTVNETSYNSASLTWNAGKDETEWNIQYKKTSESEWSNPIHVTELPTTENPYILTDLKRGADYDVRVQAYCDAEDQSEWSNPVIFTTECGIWPIDNANALFENFNDDAFPPACWNWIKVNNYYGWQHSSGQYNPLDQQGTAYSYWPSGDTYLILPHTHIDGNATLSFDMVFQGSGSGEESSVVLSTTGTAAAEFTTTLWTANEFPTNKTNVSIDLSNYNGQDIYIAFKYAGVGTSGRMWYIDNVQVYVGEVFTKDITAYSGDGGYYLIASPIGEVSPENVINMCENNYDLYAFDQAEDLEWRNYEAGSFNLEAGKGYLYANSENVTLTFTGTPYSGDGTINLTYTESAPLAGWNLIGNPFGSVAILDKPYYRLNSDGSSLNTSTENTAVAALEGVFVQATAAGQSANFVTITTGNDDAIEPQAVPQVNIKVQHNRGNVIDNAIVRFDGGSMLGKFTLNESSTRLYVPQNGQNFAIVSAKAAGEMPVDFKAENNGTYTLSFDVKNVEMKHLHLIDNMNGTDIDLLVNPNYTFEARTTDYASRFKLVFASDCGDTDNEAFAYFNGSAWSVSNMGEATLQVIDMHGRVLRSATINGNASIGTDDLKAGVYVMRLISRDNVKTQKIIIK